MGDPAGIGPDITLKAWAARHESAVPAFVFVGDPETLEARARQLELAVPVETIASPQSAPAVFPRALPVLAIELPAPAAGGRPDPASASTTLKAIETAVDLVLDEAAAALVANPVNKALLYGQGFAHPGHTEYLAALARGRGHRAEPVMMLVCDDLRVVPATIHIPLRDVPAAVTEDLLLRTIRITARDVARCFGLQPARVAVTGLNPHAGESGTLGTEETEVIVPALDALRAEGLHVSGPHAADTVFRSTLRDSYDVVVAMYHDQALAPIKTLAFERAVNVTLGLPFVRTSPDHGVAYDLAGTGAADPTSLIEALRLAGQLAARQRAAA